MLACLLLRKKRHVHLAFKIPISDYESFNKIITFIADHWEKRKNFFSDYRMTYLRLNGDFTMFFSFSFFFLNEEKNGKATNCCSRKIVQQNS